LQSIDNAQQITIHNTHYATTQCSMAMVQCVGAIRNDPPTPPKTAGGGMLNSGGPSSPSPIPILFFS
jgi:hypothetical protein